MILNRSHLPWAFFILLATVAAGALYLANFHPLLLPFPLTLPAFFGPIPPVRNTVGGSPLGLFFGTVALLIFLFASALGVRKKRRLWRIGHVQLWLKAHVWLTLFTIPLICFHGGFRTGGPMTTTLVVIYALVMGSGFFGLAMQQILPTLMTESLPREVVYEQIPHIRGMIRDAALSLRKELRTAAKATAPAPAKKGTATTEVEPTAAPPQDDASEQALADFLDQECLPYLFAERGDRRQLGDQKVSDDVFRLLKLSVSEKFRPKADDIQQWCDDRRQMDYQMRLHHWLHGWLLIHVPLSFTLLVLTVWHAWIAMTYL